MNAVPMSTVTNEDGDYAKRYAGTPEAAAEAWAEEHHAEAEWPEEMIAEVTDESGNVSRWRVCVEMRPHFSAIPASEVARIDTFNAEQRKRDVAELGLRAAAHRPHCDTCGTEGRNVGDWCNSRLNRSGCGGTMVSRSP